MFSEIIVVILSCLATKMFSEIIFAILSCLGIGPIQIADCGLPCFVLMYYSGYIIGFVILVSILYMIINRDRSDDIYDSSLSSGATEEDLRH